MQLLPLGRAGQPGVIGPESIRQLVFGVEHGVVQNLTLISIATHEGSAAGREGATIVHATRDD